MFRASLYTALAAGLLVLAGSGRAEENPVTGFVDKVYKGPDGQESRYVVFVPRSYSGDKEYPVILFLHGAGEKGTEGKKQVGTGLGKHIRGHEKDFEFIAVFPQAKQTWSAKSADGKQAVAILDEVMKEYKTDKKHVYLTGLSMGGFGTWSLAAEYPDRWAAIAPICGGGDPRSAEKIKDVPCWCFHGDADPTVKVERSRDMIKALKDAGGDPKYTEYPGVGHNSWDKAYATKELYDWMLTHKRK